MYLPYMSFNTRMVYTMDRMVIMEKLCIEVAYQLERSTGFATKNDHTYKEGAVPLLTT
mgnify:FL=1